MKIFLQLMQLIPQIISAMFALQSQTTIPGDTKKQIILSAIGAAAHVGEIIPVPLVQAISAFIDTTAAQIKAGEIAKTPKMPVDTAPGAAPAA